MSGNGKESSLPPVLPEEEDLPPGVRKHNRCHSSSSSESEDDADKKKQQSIEVDSSDSDSEKSDHDSSRKDSKKKEDPQQDAMETKAGSKEKDLTSKVGRSRSRSESRSKSRSASPKRRRSSEKSSRRSRSRSRDRRHRRDRKHRSHRSRSKERRRSRDRHRHKKDRRRSRSRSRSRDRKERRYNSRRSSRDRDRRRRSRSRDRRDSRSPSPHDGKVIKFGNKVIKPGASFGRPTSNFNKPVTFKEKMRQQLIKAIEEGADTNEVLANKGSTICTQSAGVQQQSMPKPKGPPVPLMDTLVPSTASLAAMTVTASEAAMQSMLALQKEATEKTGIEIPKYYNPAAINPMKYAEQVQKRKLLWSKAKDKDVNSQWHATSLSGDADDKSKEKFRKLMGIKNDPSAAPEKEEKQKQLFDQLNKEYEFARMATHTHRGIGLGFSSSSGYPQQPPNVPPQPPQQPPTSTS